jgi:hypothetical protein
MFDLIALRGGHFLNTILRRFCKLESCLSCILMVDVYYF